MAAEIWRTATEHRRNTITIKAGSVDDISMVGVFHTIDPSVVPTVAQFTPVTLVKPGDPLAEGDLIDVLSLTGPDGGEPALVLEPGDYQRWILVVALPQRIIRRLDVLEVK